MGGGTGAGASGSGRELFRSGRAFAAGDPGDLAGATGFPDRGSIADDVRKSDCSTLGRAHRIGETGRESTRGATCSAGAQGGDAPVVLCAAAAVVHRPTGA